MLHLLFSWLVSSLRPDLPGITGFQESNFQQRVVGTYQAKYMCTHIFLDVFRPLLEPFLGLLGFLD
jgi:hypothetical protein